MKSNSILTETEQGTYYTGPITSAIRVMYEEYGSDITVRHVNNGGGMWQVVEHRGNPSTSPNQGGAGATEEEAWRYFIGAEFGPLDDVYEAEGYEAHQRKMLGLAPLEPEAGTCRITIDVPMDGSEAHPSLWDWDALVGVGTKFVGASANPDL